MNPRTVFERLFGEGESNDPATRAGSWAERRSILDYVTGSIDRLQTRLGPGDRNKLSEYLDSIRDLERRIQKTEQQNAARAVPLPVMEHHSAVPDTIEEPCKLIC